jgi:lysophospholipase L1-like esterase
MNIEEINDYLKKAQTALKLNMLDQCNTIIAKINAIIVNLPEADRASITYDLKKFKSRLMHAVKNKQNLHIVVNGDSLSLPRPWRNRSFDPINDPKLSTSFEDCYDALLSKDLNINKGSYKHIFVTNLSKASSTINEIMTRNTNAFHYHNPDLVILHFGIVDCALRLNKEGSIFQNTNPGTFRKLYRNILKYKKGTCLTKRMIVLPIMKVSNRTEAKFPGQNASIDEYNTVLAKGLDRYSEFLNIDEVCGDKFDQKLAHLDGYHLSTAGHQLIFEKLSERIYQLFPRLKQIENND